MEQTESQPRVRSDTLCEGGPRARKEIARERSKQRKHGREYQEPPRKTVRSYVRSAPAHGEPAGYPPARHQPDCHLVEPAVGGQGAGAAPETKQVALDIVVRRPNGRTRVRSDGRPVAAQLAALDVPPRLSRFRTLPAAHHPWTCPQGSTRCAMRWPLPNRSSDTKWRAPFGDAVLASSHSRETPPFDSRGEQSRVRSVAGKGSVPASGCLARALLSHLSWLQTAGRTARRVIPPSLG